MTCNVGWLDLLFHVRHVSASLKKGTSFLAEYIKGLTWIAFMHNKLHGTHQDSVYYTNRGTCVFPSTYRAASYQAMTNTASHTTTRSCYHRHNRVSERQPKTTTRQRVSGPQCWLVNRFSGSSHFSSQRGSFAPRRSRTPSVSCTHHTVGRSTQDSRNQLGIHLPAWVVVIKFCCSISFTWVKNLGDPEEEKCGCRIKSAAHLNKGP